MKKTSKKEKGITLVALVVTVIILLLLAGITLTLVLGQNGLINKAREAKYVSLNDQTATEKGLNKLYNEMVAQTDGTTSTKVSDVSTVKDAIDKNVTPVAQDTQLKDDNNATVIVPAGFKISGDSATNVDGGIIIEDKDGNQFVWIPVDISNYIRTDFGKQYGTYSNYSETMSTDEQTSVTNNHGYYIGRYEAGDSVSTDGKTLRSGGASVTNKVAIKKGQAPYDYVTRDQAKTIAEGMKNQEEYAGTTKLCSSYAWDTAVNFIQKATANYGTSSNQGNYHDTAFSYTDISGTSQTKTSSSSSLIPTGQTTPVCSIYDMGGNEWEWTTENSSDTNNPCVIRGGYYSNNNADWPAGSRSYVSTSISDDHTSFRVALYL